jgi:predicted enzyme related to lactoylglutathione lyase
MTVPEFFEADTKSMLKELLGRGVLGGLFFTVENCQEAFEELKSRGVEFSQEPTQQPYGIDAGFRDSSGNGFRMMQAPDAA